MSETAAERQPTKPFLGTLNEYPGELAEFPPTIGYVVHQVASGKQGRGVVWAWCQVVEGSPGYAGVTFTRPDGVTAVEVPEDDLTLGLVLFKVFC